MKIAEEQALITDSAVKTALGGGTGLTDKNTSEPDAAEQAVENFNIIKQQFLDDLSASVTLQEALWSFGLKFKVVAADDKDMSKIAAILKAMVATAGKK